MSPHARHSTRSRRASQECYLSDQHDDRANSPEVQFYRQQTLKERMLTEHSTPANDSTEMNSTQVGRLAADSSATAPITGRAQRVAHRATTLMRVTNAQHKKRVDTHTMQKRAVARPFHQGAQPHSRRITRVGGVATWTDGAADQTTPPSA